MHEVTPCLRYYGDLSHVGPNNFRKTKTLLNLNRDSSVGNSRRKSVQPQEPVETADKVQHLEPVENNLQFMPSEAGEDIVVLFNP
jgi:hypothetical protein